MKRANFEFYGELNELLPPSRRGHVVLCEFNGSQSIKHLIESQGIPHTEIGKITVNSSPVDTSYQVQDGDWVKVWPAPISGGVEDHLQNVGHEIKFILDNHLGKLASYLRMLGFDTLYRNDYEDTELAETSQKEGRILLTRDRRLLMRKQVQAGYCIKKHNPQAQLRDVLKRFDMHTFIKPFQRCMRCNTLLDQVQKEQILDQLEPLTNKYYDSFSICPGCRQVYWPGSHYEHMQRMIHSIFEDEQN